jgi:anti-sigma regulatory factor (Ser/Thr protein kinase)
MLVTAPRELAVSYPLDSDPVQVARAREQARKTLPGWGLGEHADVAELIVSERVTNAMVHGEGQIEVRLSCAGGDLWAEVHDDPAGSAPSR